MWFVEVNQKKTPKYAPPCWFYQIFAIFMIKIPTRAQYFGRILIHCAIWFVEKWTAFCWIFRMLILFNLPQKQEIANDYFVIVYCCGFVIPLHTNSCEKYCYDSNVYIWNPSRGKWIVAKWCVQWHICRMWTAHQNCFHFVIPIGFSQNSYNLLWF